MKEKIIFLLLCISICIQLCSCNKETVIWDTDNESAEQNITQQEDAETVEAGQATYLEEEPPQQNMEQEESEQEQIVYEAPLPLGEYRIVQPTQAELDEILPRLDLVFSTFHDDYDSSSDNIYNYLFDYDYLSEFVYPQYKEEAKQYVAPPMSYYEGDTSKPRWYKSVKAEDPRGKYPKLVEEILDENGKIDYELTQEYLKNHSFLDTITGHTKYSGEYIDWLVEGVWNGKADHETFFTFDDGSRCYYYDGCYILPEHDLGGRGSGGPYYTRIDSMTPVEDGKYELCYTVLLDMEDVWGNATAVIALKEAENGFRFWSIYSIDYQSID